MFTLTILKIVPKNLLSRIIGTLISIRWPWPFGYWVVKGFAKFYKINLMEAEKPLSQYKSIQELFTRRLKPHVRPIQSQLVHPCDSEITSYGEIQNSQLIQAKGITYSLEEFLGPHHGVDKYKEGFFITYYLCPTDYHRVHSPVMGEVLSATHLVGHLWPVNKMSVSKIANLFSINERVVSEVKTEKGHVAVVLVGATNVGKMTLSFDQHIITNQSHIKTHQHKTYNPPIKIKAGDEFGVFNMGSTVILLFEKEFFTDKPHIKPGCVKMGEPLVREH